MCFYIYTIIGTSAPVSVSVNCLAQDSCYKAYGRPAFFTMSAPVDGDIRRWNICREVIVVNKKCIRWWFCSSLITFIYLFIYLLYLMFSERQSQNLRIHSAKLWDESELRIRKIPKGSCLGLIVCNTPSVTWKYCGKPQKTSVIIPCVPSEIRGSVTSEVTFPGLINLF
jgi:hypothetical protein